MRVRGFGFASTNQATLDDPFGWFAGDTGGTYTPARDLNQTTLDDPFGVFAMDRGYRPAATGPAGAPPSFLAKYAPWLVSGAGLLLFLSAIRGGHR